jgi:hypothetical protein
VIVQPAQLMVARRLVWMAGRAVATIVESIELMNSAVATIPKMSRRDGPGSPADGTCKPTECSIATVVTLPNDCGQAFRRILAETPARPLAKGGRSLPSR